MADSAHASPADDTTGTHRAQTIRQVIASYEMISGALGIVFVLWLVFSRALPLAKWPTSTIPFALVAAAGWILRKEQGSDTLSMVVQVPQVVFWFIGQSAWKMCAGLFVTVSLVGTVLRLFAGFDVSLTEGWTAEHHPFIVGINLVPVGVIVALRWSRHRMRRGLGHTIGKSEG